MDGNELRVMTRHNAAELLQALLTFVEMARRVVDGTKRRYCAGHGLTLRVEDMDTCLNADNWPNDCEIVEVIMFIDPGDTDG